VIVTVSYWIFNIGKIEVLNYRIREILGKLVCILQTAVDKKSN